MLDLILRGREEDGEGVELRLARTFREASRVQVDGLEERLYRRKEEKHARSKDHIKSYSPRRYGRSAQGYCDYELGAEGDRGTLGKARHVML